MLAHPRVLGIVVFTSVAAGATSLATNAPTTPPDSVPAPTRLALPPPPEPHVMAGEVAIAWVNEGTPDERSVLLERDGDAARELGRVMGRVFASTKDLFWLDKYSIKMTLGNYVEMHSDCRASHASSLEIPCLRSVGTGKCMKPWGFDIPQKDLSDSEVTFDVWIEGAVGSILFARTFTTVVGCGSVCPMHVSATIEYDLDRDKLVKLTFPQVIIEPLRKLALQQVSDLDFVECGEMDPYRATAEYDEAGVLHGIYEFGTDDNRLCATVPGCPNPQLRSPWVAPELSRWAKLPKWMKEFTRLNNVKHAFVLGPTNTPLARKHFATAAQSTKMSTPPLLTSTSAKKP